MRIQSSSFIWPCNSSWFAAAHCAVTFAFHCRSPILGSALPKMDVTPGMRSPSNAYEWPVPRLILVIRLAMVCRLAARRGDFQFFRDFVYVVFAEHIAISPVDGLPEVRPASART